MENSDSPNEDAVPPEPVAVAVVTDEGGAVPRPRAANDSTPDDAVEVPKVEAAPAPEKAEPEGLTGTEAVREVETEQPPSVIRAKTPPPADPTEIPIESSSMALKLVVEKIPTKPPLLASDALMEDLAPLEPSRDVARFWCAVVGIGFAALGILPLVGLRPGGALTAGLSFFLGGVTLVAALTKVSYRQRAFAMLVIGLLVVLVGLGGTGPAAFVAHNAPGLGFARAFAAIALPGALLFRARYRAYSGARWALGAAFVLALPFVGLIIWRLFSHTPDLSTAGSIVALVVTLVGLVGFMGKETTGAGTYVGLSVLVGLGTELFLLDLSHLESFEYWPSVLTTVLGTVAFIAATGLAALGLFQLLASRLSGDARRIDLHAALPEPSRPRPKKSEWTA